MKKYIVFFAAILLATSCENTWDGESKDLFHQGCMNAAKNDGMAEDKAKAMCDCRLEKVMEKYPKFADAMANLTQLMTDTSFKSCDPK